MQILTEDDPDLARIRRKKMAELVKREKLQQATKDREQKVEVERNKLLQRYLAPDALQYLEDLKSMNPGVGNKVQEVLLYLIVYRGVRQIIRQLDVRYIERQVKGEEPKIRVQRDGETSDLGQYVKDALKKNGP
ncbi:MAG: DNA-binding protein [Candidatus Hodarchaeota archaeon]